VKTQTMIISISMAVLIICVPLTTFANYSGNDPSCYMRYNHYSGKPTVVKGMSGEWTRAILVYSSKSKDVYVAHSDIHMNVHWMTFPKNRAFSVNLFTVVKHPEARKEIIRGIKLELAKRPNMQMNGIVDDFRVIECQTGFRIAQNAMYNDDRWGTKFLDSQGHIILLQPPEAERKKVITKEMFEVAKGIINFLNKELEIAKDRGFAVQLENPDAGIKDRFIAYKNGTVLDTKTNLMWAAKDNGSDIDWENAKAYCENYRGGGYPDWRMPTKDELAGLYNTFLPGYPQDCGSQYQDIQLTNLIHLSCCCPWASEKRGSDAAYFQFYTGERSWGRQSGGRIYRALPVRSGK